VQHIVALHNIIVKANLLLFSATVETINTAISDLHVYSALSLVTTAMDGGNAGFAGATTVPTKPSDNHASYVSPAPSACV